MEVAAFATGEPLSHDELANAPLRSLPRPSRLFAELDVKPKRAAVAAEALGLLTLGDLIEHFPRDHAARRAAAEVANLPTRGRPARALPARPRRPPGGGGDPHPADRRGRDGDRAGPPDIEPPRARPADAAGGDRRRPDRPDEGGLVQPAVARRQAARRHER